MTEWEQDAQDLVDRVLKPAAADVDRSGKIPATHFEALAERGYYGLAFTDGDPVRTLSRVGEILICGCLSTAFVWAQHHGTLMRLATSINDAPKTRYLDRLRRGDLRAGVSGVAYAQADKPLVTAKATADGGYTIHGRAPFVTGWGLIDVIGISAYDAEADTAVTFLADAVDGPGMHASPLALTAADASQTVALHFDGLPVPAESVIGVAPSSGTGSSSPAERIALRINGSLALGVARGSLATAGELGYRSERLHTELDDVRRRLDDALADDGDLHAARARAARFAVTAATYCATATGSTSVTRGNAAERHVREAAFALVCATTSTIKRDLLTDLERTDLYTER